MIRFIEWLLVSLCLVLSGLAGSSNQSSAQKIVTIRGTSPTSYMLDGQPTVTRAYALRRLLTSYSTNKLINIIRASDSTTTDIGFDATGAIDTATATTFCNATTCKVVTWYDQSGNTTNITQGTDANRPALVFSCLGNYPCVQFTGTTQSLATAGNTTPATGTVSFAVVANRAVGTAGCTWLRENGNNNRIISTNGAANTWAVVAGGVSLFGTATDAAWSSGIGAVNSGVALGSTLSINGVETVGTLTGNTTAAPTGIFVTSSTCNIVSSMLFDNVALTVTQRTMLTNNQRAWWGF